MSSKKGSHNSRAFPADKMFPKDGFLYSAWADGIPTVETQKRIKKKKHTRKSRMWLKNDLREQLAV